MARTEEAVDKTVLLVEDDAEARQILAAALSQAGLRVLEAESAKMGLHLFRSGRPELLILDVNLPDGSGIEVCRGARQHPELGAVPIVMLTGLGQFDAKSEGFFAGADHYFVKPVEPRELVLWVRALFRRLALDKDEGKVLEAGPLAIDPKGRVVRFDGELLRDITAREFDLLYALVRRRPKALSRRFILSKVWRTVATDNVVDAHVRNLRRKLPREAGDRVQSVPGRGFRYFAS